MGGGGKKMKSKKKTEKKVSGPTNVAPEASSSSLNPPATASSSSLNPLPQPPLKCRFLKLNGDVIESVEIPMKKVLDGAKVQDVGAALAAKLSDPCSPVRQRLREFADRTVVWGDGRPKAWLLMRVAMDKLIQIDNGDDKNDDNNDGPTFKFIEFNIFDFKFNCAVVDYGTMIAEELAEYDEEEEDPHIFAQALATLAPTDVEDLRRCLEVFGDTKPRKAATQRMRDIVEIIVGRLDYLGCGFLGLGTRDRFLMDFTDIALTAIGTTVRSASISELQNGDGEMRTLLVETPKGGTTEIVFADEKRADIVRLACQVLQWLPAAMRCESDSVPAGACEVYSETFSHKLKSDNRNDVAWEILWNERSGGGIPPISLGDTPKLLAMGGRFLRAVYVPTYLSPLIDDMETEHRYMRRHILKFICLDQAPAADVEPLEGSFPLSELLPFADATSGSPVLDLHVMGTV